MFDWLLFVAEMKVLSPKCLWLEITATTPESFHKEACDALGLTMISGIDCPTSKGVPTRRPRRYSFAYDASVFSFDGSFQEYQQLLTRACVMDGDSFLLSSKAERQTHMRLLSESRRSFFAEEQELHIRDVITVDQSLRLDHHFDTKNLKSSLSGACLTDLNHRPKWTTSSSMFPTITKRAKIVSLEDGGGSLVTPLELWAAQGENVFPEVGNDDYPCYLQVDKIPRCALVRMAGNTMHTVSMGLFMLYCLSRLRFADGPGCGNPTTAPCFP